MKPKIAPDFVFSMTSEYYTLLTRLSQRLSKDDLNSLVFSCGNILPPSTAEKITTSYHLFQELKQRGHLGPVNYDYLRKQLVLVGRHDLASMLPDQFEILFGRSSVRSKDPFGCFASPSAPDTDLVNVSMLKYFHPNTESRMLLMHLSEQLKSEDAMKLAFLMYPTHSQVTALDFAEHIEREGGLNSVDVVNRLSSCLEVVGRVDLAQVLHSLKTPQVLLASFSTSQQQLSLKMRLLLHSKHQSYDFHMKALRKVETDSEVRMKLLNPIIQRIQQSFEESTILARAKNLETAILSNSTSHKIDLDSLINISLLKALEVDNAYRNAMQVICVANSKDVPIEELCDLTERLQKSYKSFGSIMDILNWNSVIRGELKETIERHRSPFGTSADLACQYILELSQEISQCSEIYREKQKIDHHLRALHSVYYSCCHYIIVIQWLASLLCFSTSFNSAVQLNLCKYKETLWHIVQQRNDDIMQSYSCIAKIIGPDVLEKLNILLPEGNTDSNQSPWVWQWPFVHLFNVLVIKLLTVATLGPDHTLTDYYFVDNNQALCCGSQVIMASAAAMKMQVEALREKALSKDRLCSQVIATLTVTDS